MEGQPEGEFTNLVRMIQAEPQAGENIRILALEIYDMGFAIRWALPSGLGPQPETAEEAGFNPLGLMSLTLRDDLGTPYERASMLGGGVGQTFAGIDFYKPAIPAEASYLDVFVKDGFVRFQLRDG